MPFSVNDSFLYIVSAVMILFVVAQSVFFLVKAIRRARQLNIPRATITKTIFSSGLFSIAPAVAILVGVISLSATLGLPFPWLRLSVLGALTYELPAATVAMKASGAAAAGAITDPRVFATVAWVMTVGILSGIILVLFGLKKIQKGVHAITDKDKRWGAIVMDSLFLGMISAFVGMLFADIGKGRVGWVPMMVAAASAILMALCGLLIRVCHVKWLEQYALPLCMLGAMALSLPITALMA